MNTLSLAATKKKHTLRGIAFALLAGVCWGLSGTIGQYLFEREALDSTALTVVRLLSAGALLTLYTLVRSPRRFTALFREKSDTLRLAVFAVAGLMAVQLSYLKAISYSNSGTATAIQYLGEPLILIVTCLRAKRKPHPAEGFGLLLACAGILLLTTHGQFGSLQLSVPALVWGLISAAALAAYTMLPTGLIRRYGSTSVTGCGMLLGGAVLAVVTRVWRIPFHPTETGLLLILAIVLVGTVLAFTLFLQSASEIGAVKAGLLAATETLSAPLFSAVWLKTPFTLWDVGGFVLMFLMVILLALPELRQAKETKEKPLPEGSSING